jgi:flavin-dependent dehydrogenase
VLSRQTAFLCRSALPSGERLVIEKGRQGWWYALPVPGGGTFMGYCTEHLRVREDRDAWFLETLSKTRLLSDLAMDRIDGVWGVPARIRKYDRAIGTDWLAMGDAAFTPDPLCGEGIWFACETARLAAGVVAGSVSAGAYQDWIDGAAASHLSVRDVLLAS